MFDDASDGDTVAEKLTDCAVGELGLLVFGNVPMVWFGMPLPVSDRVVEEHVQDAELAPVVVLVSEMVAPVSVYGQRTDAVDVDVPPDDDDVDDVLLVELVELVVVEFDPEPSPHETRTTLSAMLATPPSFSNLAKFRFSTLFMRIVLAG